MKRNAWKEVEAIRVLKNHTKETPVSARVLGVHVNYDTTNSTSGVRGLVRNLIKKGHPILSDRNGYWYSGSHQDLQEDMNRKQDTQAAYAGRIHAVWTAANRQGGVR
jgi:hypothetical protein